MSIVEETDISIGYLLFFTMFEFSNDILGMIVKQF